MSEIEQVSLSGNFQLEPDINSCESYYRRLIWKLPVKRGLDTWSGRYKIILEPGGIYSWPVREIIKTYPRFITYSSSDR